MKTNLVKVGDAYSTPVAASGDRNDCCVRALSVAANLPYEQCHALMAKHGRKNGKGTPYATSDAVHAELGHEVTRHRGLGPTLAQFIRANPKGRFVVHRKWHAFALVDGVVHDWYRSRTGSRSRVYYSAFIPS